MDIFTLFFTALDNIEKVLAEVVIASLPTLWNGFVFVLINGGWVVFAVLLVWIYFFNIRFIRKIIENYGKLDPVCLNISVPEGMTNNSIMSAEQIFVQLYSTFKPMSWRETYWEGKFVPAYSFELVSLGGLIRYIVRVPRASADLVKTAFFAQYPNAEITEVEDYMNALPTPFMPDTVDYDFWGTELMFTQKSDKYPTDAYPIKTYPHFEHRAAEIIIDPLAALLEALSNIGPEEMVAIHILAQPGDGSGDVKKKSAGLVEDLKGKPQDPLSKEPNQLRYKSDSERDTIKAVQGKLSKLWYRTKIQVMYAAPKDKMKAPISSIMGGFGQFNHPDWNGLRPNGFVTTRKPDPKLFSSLEDPRLNEILLWRKRFFIEQFKGRNIWEPGRNYYMSTEELATLYHFPIEGVRKSSIERTDAKKGEAPVNLPV